VSESWRINRRKLLKIDKCRVPTILGQWDLQWFIIIFNIWVNIFLILWIWICLLNLKIFNEIWTHFFFIFRINQRCFLNFMIVAFFRCLTNDFVNIISRSFLLSMSNFLINKLIDIFLLKLFQILNHERLLLVLICLLMIGFGEWYLGFIVVLNCFWSTSKWMYLRLRIVFYGS